MSVYIESVLLLNFFYVYRAVNAFVYYGLSLNSTSMSGNKYINFALTCLIEIPGYSLAWICIRKIGRRISLVGSLLLCSLTCTATIFVPSSQFHIFCLSFINPECSIFTRNSKRGRKCKRCKLIFLSTVPPFLNLIICTFKPVEIKNGLCTSMCSYTIIQNITIFISLKLRY